MKPTTVEKRVAKAMEQDKPMTPQYLKWYTGASERQLRKFFKHTRNALEEQGVLEPLPNSEVIERKTDD